MTKRLIYAIITHMGVARFFTQQDFAQKRNVAFSTVNRWELHKAKTNMKAMKKLKEFCDEYGIDYEIIEKEWLIF